MKNIAVVDPRGCWMAQWDRQFSCLRIPHLRSPFDQHPAPFDSYAMQAYVEYFKREDEFVSLEHIDGSSGAEYRQGVFKVMGTKVFMDFCTHLVQMYGLENDVTAGTVSRIEPIAAAVGDPVTEFRVHLHGADQQPQVLRTRRVVMAIGSTSVPRTPMWAKGLLNSSQAPPHTFRHAWTLVQQDQSPGVATARAESKFSKRHKNKRQHQKKAAATAAAMAAAAAIEELPSKPTVKAATKVSPAPGELTKEEWLLFRKWQASRQKKQAEGKQAKTKTEQQPSLASPPQAPQQPQSQPQRGRPCTPKALPSAGAANVNAVSAPVNSMAPELCSLAGERLLVVGGGLTSAHLVSMAVDAGCTDVVLVCRSELRIKQFDLNPGWLTWRTRPHMISSFLGKQTMEERVQMVKEARGGGSVTPEAMISLNEQQAAGVLRLWEGRQVCGAEWVQTKADGHSGGHWAVFFDDDGSEYSGAARDVGSAGNGEGLPTAEVLNEQRANSADESVNGIAFDRIWLATGSEVNVEAEPVLQQLLRDRPIELVNGLPTIHPSLAWDVDCAVYILGAYAQLQVGPDALNLGGARSGACRAAFVLREALRGKATLMEQSEVAAAAANAAVAAAVLAVEVAAASAEVVAAMAAVSSSIGGQQHRGECDHGHDHGPRGHDCADHEGEKQDGCGSHSHDVLDVTLKSAMATLIDEERNRMRSLEQMKVSYSKGSGLAMVSIDGTSINIIREKELARHAKRREGPAVEAGAQDEGAEGGEGDSIEPTFKAGELVMIVAGGIENGRTAEVVEIDRSGRVNVKLSGEIMSYEASELSKKKMSKPGKNLRRGRSVLVVTKGKKGKWGGGFDHANGNCGCDHD
jgi:hypothetical protein